jgi:glycosyltransferase involved in cell wall biosynthesis
MKIFYWSPFFAKVATISAVIDSAESLMKYKSKNDYNVTIINAIGEWNDYKKKISKNVLIRNLFEKDFVKLIPKGNFIKSRLSYIFIFLATFSKLLHVINKEKPDYFIIHLITSLPIFLSPFFNKKTKIILRISGLPKLNYFRRIFWKLYSSKIYRITCPTQSTLETIKESKIFDTNKIVLLKDPIISVKRIIKNISQTINEGLITEKYILGIGRLTTQKNFKLLLKFFFELNKKYPEYKLYILGEGEDRTLLNNIIDKFKLKSKAYLLGYQDNVFKYLKHADCFILSSLWEDPGFVLIEAGAMNTNIISSDCPNGPKEIVSNQDFLFSNNSADDLLKKFEIYKKKTPTELYNQKIDIKKKIKFYTSFHHFKKFDLIFSENNE